MSIADRFIVGLVELGEQQNQIYGAEYYKPKIEIQTSNKTQPRWTRTQQGNSRVIGQQNVYNFFFAFSVELGTKAKTYYKAHNNTSQETWNLIPLGKRLVLNLPWGRGRSIGRDLDVGEEGFEQMIITLQSLHHGFISYQHVCTRVGLTKKASPYKCNREHK
jgi:hypothetical protein